MKIKILLTSASILAATVSGPANAATLLFEISGGRNLTFQLDSNPTPSSSQTFFGEQSVFTDVPGTVNGANTTISTISFGTGIFAVLSINAPGLDFTQFAGGGPLFTGPGSAPVFSPGTFQLTNAFFPSSNSTLVISEQVAAVPEPATWAMMLIGFGFVGGAMRAAKRKQKVTVSYA
jgi:PEP-CTERM motif